MTQEYVLPLDDRRATLETVGGKGASLARLLRAGVAVPGGFHLTTAAYEQFVTANHLDSGIRATLEKVETSKPDTLESASGEIEELFLQGSMPEEIAYAISRAYADLPEDEPAVAVRSSATAEDLPGASFAGQQESFLNVRGEKELKEAVKRCWASLWTAQAIAYRERQYIDSEVVSLAVVVQRMAPAEAAGTLIGAVVWWKSRRRS
jgi:rifampicin phosphotransferase